MKKWLFFCLQKIVVSDIYYGKIYETKITHWKNFCVSDECKTLQKVTAKNFNQNHQILSGKSLVQGHEAVEEENISGKSFTSFTFEKSTEPRNLYFLIVN